MVLGPGNAFPRAVLADLEGVERPLADAWSSGPAVVFIGHRDCKTTRQTLPYVDRMFRRKGASTAVAVVLQDDPKTARGLMNEQGLEVPVLLESDPYRLAKDLSLEAVPTLFAVSFEGRIEKVIEGFDRQALESLAEYVGVRGVLFDPTDKAPAFRPG